MSTVKTYLALVLNDWDENWREELLIFDEQQTIYELEQAGMPSFPVRRERHLFFTLMQPLTDVQLKWLEEKKASGLFASFYVKDEISHEPLQQSLFEDPAEPKNTDQA